MTDAYSDTPSPRHMGHPAQMPDECRPLNIARAFAWGIVIVGDADTQDIPSSDRDKPIVSSDSAVVVRVRHAHDFESPDDDSEFIVDLECAPGGSDRNDLSFDGDILVSSGRISVGDADHEDMLVVSPGRWRLQIHTEPVEHAERVRVWFSPTDADSIR